ncbi:MAG: ATP-binding protein [Lachnospiraceae bacterium]|nr:ATP-binding protein [Lachnospiraceae bacterium]MBQ8547673.1 ATP-binding protein [Lachnospiraceae bacterium]
MNQEDYHYHRLLRSYEDTRTRHLREQKERREQVYKLIPELDVLDRQIAEASVSAARAALEGNSGPLDRLADNNRLIAEQKQQLLQAAGYPVDYLELAYTCPDCKDTGFIGQEKCHCFKQSLTFALSKASTLSNQLEKENFDTFSFSYYDDITADSQLRLTPRENMRKIVADAKKFVADFETDRRSILIYGNTGVGKTFLTNCIARALLNTPHHVVYMTAHSLFEAFEAHRFDYTEQTDVNSLYQYIFQCDLLIIDDLGTELSNAFTNSMLYTCINERQLHGKSTVISTNLSLEQFRDRYSERIFSRITGSYTLWKLIGKDIRVLKRMEGSFS